MIATIAVSAFVAAAAGAGIRLVRGPSLADRIIALDVILISFMGAVAVGAAATGDTAYLDVLVVIAIIGFTATVAASRFIEHEATLP